MAQYTELESLHARQAPALSEEDLHAGVLARLPFSSQPRMNTLDMREHTLSGVMTLWPACELCEDWVGHLQRSHITGL